MPRERSCFHTYSTIQFFSIFTILTSLGIYIVRSHLFFKCDADSFEEQSYLNNHAIKHNCTVLDISYHDNLFTFIVQINNTISYIDIHNSTSCLTQTCNAITIHENMDCFVLNNSLRLDLCIGESNCFDWVTSIVTTYIILCFIIFVLFGCMKLSHCEIYENQLDHFQCLSDCLYIMIHALITYAFIYLS